MSQARDIKFRFWKHGQMCDDFDGWSEDISTNTHFQYAKENDIAVMQYTGLRDKNGKEIYEGDVVNYAVKEKICPDCAKKEIRSELKYGISKFCPDCGKKLEQADFITTAKVEFRNGAFAYYREPQEGYYQSWKADVAAIYLVWVEIIGNIYENPELLNSEQEDKRSVATEDQSGNKS